MKIGFDFATILLIIIIFLVFVFLFADYRVFRNFIRKEQDRNISFTSQQVKDYIKTYSGNEISKEFIEEFLKDVLKTSSPEEQMNGLENE